MSASETRRFPRSSCRHAHWQAPIRGPLHFHFPQAGTSTSMPIPPVLQARRLTGRQRARRSRQAVRRMPRNLGEPISGKAGGHVTTRPRRHSSAPAAQPACGAQDDGSRCHQITAVCWIICPPRPPCPESLMLIADVSSHREPHWIPQFHPCSTPQKQRPASRSRVATECLTLHRGAQAAAFVAVEA